MHTARPGLLSPLAAGVALGLSLVFFPCVAHAEQFVLFDVTFTYTWEDAINSSPSQSHYYVNDDNVLNTARPENWLSPVDYRNGTLHVRLEVLDKPPGDQTANWTLCYIANEGGYGCAQTGVYTQEGIYDSDVEMTSWWNNEVIDWTQGIQQMDLVYKKSTEGRDHVHFFPELEELVTPTTVRITMVQVSAGDTYDPSLLPPDLVGMGGSGASGMAGSGMGGDSNVSGAGVGGNSAGVGGMVAALGGSAGAVNGGMNSGGAISGLGGTAATMPSSAGGASQPPVAMNGGSATSGSASSLPPTTTVSATTRSTSCALSATPMTRRGYPSGGVFYGIFAVGLWVLRRAASKPRTE